ncbi:MAG: MaoC family dehydratase N-terminal domain-containing protein [Chloroflexota bacterium]
MTGERDPILEEYEAQVGKEALPQPCKFVTEKGAMQKVAWAAGDTNPLWWDEKYARSTCFGGIIASPIFLLWFPLRGMWPSQRDAALNPKVELHFSAGGTLLRNVVGGRQDEWFRPIRPGDTISLSLKLQSVKKRWSKALNNNMYILDDKLVLKNQFGQIVATELRTSIRIPEK